MRLAAYTKDDLGLVVPVDGHAEPGDMIIFEDPKQGSYTPGRLILPVALNWCADLKHHKLEITSIMMPVGKPSIVTSVNFSEERTFIHMIINIDGTPKLIVFVCVQAP